MKYRRSWIGSRAGSINHRGSYDVTTHGVRAKPGAATDRRSRSSVYCILGAEDWDRSLGKKGSWHGGQLTALSAPSRPMASPEPVTECEIRRAPCMVRFCSVLPCPLCRGRHSRPDKNHFGARLKTGCILVFCRASAGCVIACKTGEPKKWFLSGRMSRQSGIEKTS